MRKFKYILILIVLICGSSCELDLQDNPNSLKPEQADVDFLLNNIELNFRDFFANANGFGMDMTRMRNMFGSTYENAYTATNFDAMWEDAYANIFKDVETLLPLAEENGLFFHVGVAKTLKAYTLITLVDYFGDIPYSETLDATNFNPKPDNGAAVYAAARGLLDEALVAFEKASPRNGDLYYSSPSNYIKLVNTIKLKIYLQTRLVDAAASKAGIESLVPGGDLGALISTPGEDFVFQYATANSNPDSRHPDFTNNYVNGAADYMSNYFMYVLYNEKSVVDPRMNYYFYRQTLTISTSTINLPCAGAAKPTHYPADVPYCTVGDGYWGRDHLDDDGIPPDAKLRTTWGVYPVGGSVDLGDPADLTQNSGGKGAGIRPIMLSSFVRFMLAEAALTLNVSGLDAKALLTEGVSQSIDKVISFGEKDPEYDEATDAPPANQISDYIEDVESTYDASSDKLEVIAKEYWIALYGNGIEAFNLYRRTGKPADLQPALSTNPGTPYRSFTYPANYVNRNQNAQQKTTNGVQVFWDTNPAGFID